MKAKPFILHALSFCWVKEVYVGETVNLEHYLAEKDVWWLVSQSFYGKSIKYANRYAYRSENATHYEFYDRMEMWQMKVIRFHFKNGDGERNTQKISIKRICEIPHNLEPDNFSKSVKYVYDIR